MLDPLIIAAIVELLYQLLKATWPEIPVTREMINAILLFLLGLFTYRAAVKPVIRRLFPTAEERGLIARD